MGRGDGDVTSLPDHEVNTQDELKALIPLFMQWYNERRLHSSLEYRTPAAALADELAGILS